MRAPVIAAAALLTIAPLCRADQAPPAHPTGSASVPDRAALLQQAAAAQQASRYRSGDAAPRAGGEPIPVGASLARAGAPAVALEQATAALASLTKARELAPNSEEVLSAYAQLALASKQPMPAVMTLAPLTRMCPSVAQDQYLLGVGLMALGDMSSAVEALQEADRLEPDRALTLLAMGLAFNNRKLFAEARTALTRSLELEPQSADAVAALAEAEAGLGEDDAAAAHAREALGRVPSNATANLVVGLVALERRDYGEARDALLKANQTDPQSPKGGYQLSLVFARLGDDASARRDVDLYQAKLRDLEERLKALRTGGALAPGQPQR